jgi:plastocyanin
MNTGRTIPLLTPALALVFSLGVSTDNGGTHSDLDRINAPQDVLVQFGDPDTLVGAGNQVLVPDETAILKGGTVSFIVNGAGHGIAIYPVSNNTTREDITAQLCPHDPACGDPAFANTDRTIRDGKNNVIIVTGENPPFQRVDDPTDRLLATSTQIGGVAGPFLIGTPESAIGTQLQFRFAKTGRYLVICMNRNHFLNNWMFGFVDVVGGDNG